MTQCAGIKADGGRCKGQAISNSRYCFSHSPDHAEARKQRASKGGKRGGRGRPVAETSNIKQRLEELAEDVLAGRKDRQDAAVAGQLYNYALRAVSVALKAREQEDLIERLEELETVLERQDRGG